MGLRIIEGNHEGDSNGYAVLYCSTSMTALPWIFDSGEDAEAFVETHGDIRRLSDHEQEALFNAFQTSRRAKEETNAGRRRRVVSVR